jgi:hypothetical protein
MQYYRSKATGKILSEGSLKVLNDVFGNEVIPNMVADGLLVSIETPSVVECIRSGNLASAFTRYRELHDCTMDEAKKAVYSMCADISRTNGVIKRKKKKAAANHAK